MMRYDGSTLEAYNVSYRLELNGSVSIDVDTDGILDYIVSHVGTQGTTHMLSFTELVSKVDSEILEDSSNVTLPQEAMYDSGANVVTSLEHQKSRAKLPVTIAYYTVTSLVLICLLFLLARIYILKMTRIRLLKSIAEVRHYLATNSVKSKKELKAAFADKGWTSEEFDYIYDHL